MENRCNPCKCNNYRWISIQNCSSLATVTFEQGSQLKTIAGGYFSGGSSYYGAFSNCTALTSIEIPASVETIEATAFKG
ncbi:MAG: leucine-rich repeat protein, partial [Alistipes finegoldii]